MLTIGQVALKTGLRASAIRYYEEQGLLPLALRCGGKRVYDESILEKLSVIELAKTAGFTLCEIRGLLVANGERPRRVWTRVIHAKRVELEREMSRLALVKSVLTRLDSCGCATLADCGRVFEAAVAKYKATHE